jgi:allantoin racemase
MNRILVINPNSNASVTRGIENALISIGEAKGMDIDCIDLDDAPFGIETDQDIQVVSPMIVHEVSTRADNYDAFVIACYSDPGLAECRMVAKKPVLGIHESAITLSATYGRRFGVLALGRESIQRHIMYVRQLGLQTFHTGERPLNISVDQAANDPQTLAKIIEAGRELIEEDGAETVILGCAGMAKHRQAAQIELGVPVIDPVQAAVTLVAQFMGLPDPAS